MRLKILSIAIALWICTLASGCAASKPAEPVRLRVLTYNLHHCAGIDGKLDVARIAKVIKAVDPDFVALQEVDRNTDRTGHVDQAAELGKLTHMEHVFGKAMDFSGGEYGDAVLSKRKIDRSLIVPLKWRPIKDHEPRCAVSVQCKVNGETITFISTHLDHTGGDNDRAIQVSSINYAFNLENPAILAGDMNATPDSNPMKLLEKQWTNTTGADAAPTIPSKDPKFKIDYVLFKPFERFRVVETRVLDEAVASDHRAFLGVIELLPAKK